MIEVNENILKYKDKMIYEFPYKIKDFKFIKDRVIVLIESPVKSNFNENIFCLNLNGDLIWQVEKIDHIYSDSPYDSIEVDEKVILKADNYDSFLYELDIETGKILDKRFTK